MPHWTSSPEAGRELEIEYNSLLQQYVEMKKSDPKAAYDFNNNVLSPVAADLRRARAHWRSVGESVAAFVDPNAEGARTFGKVENNREDRDDVVGMDNTSTAKGAKAEERKQAKEATGTTEEDGK